MRITFDPAKRAATLEARGLDFVEAEEVFGSLNLQFNDDRKVYGERRTVTIGFLRGRMVFVGWTQRGESRHVFTMSKCNAREQKKYGRFFV